MLGKKTRIVSDCFNEYSEYMPDAVPVDLYGKRVWKTKGEASVESAGEDIREFYGLTGKKGFS